MADPLLALCADLPQLEVPAGTRVLRDGDRSDRILVLVEGEVAVRKGGVRVAAVATPGSCFGEMSVLLGGNHTADVDAQTDARFFVLDHATQALQDHPDLLFGVARLMADRLRLVTAFLADLKRQYGDAEGNLALVDTVLDALLRHTGAPPETGSEREPDPQY